ncbi:MAG: YafY family protein [Saprospiraceae bacterium]
MTSPEKPRLARLTTILIMLQSKRLTTATELAERFGVSVRTIYRDIRTLEQSGVPIVTEEGKGYSLMEGFSLPPVMFTEREANALVTATKFLKLAKDDSLSDDFDAAIAKVKSVLSGKQKERLEFLENRMVVAKSIYLTGISKFLGPIQEALTQYLCVKIEYTNEKGIPSERIIEPFSLYHSYGENWVLAAYCRKRKDFRVFRIDRMKNLFLTSEHFEPHNMTVKEFVEKYIYPQINP